MGTRVLVETWHINDHHAFSCNEKVMSNMHRIDALMSAYKPESEISQVNNKAHRFPVTVSEELFKLLTRSVEFSELSDGAFDITYASVGHQYDYRQHEKPADEEILEYLDKVNYRNLKLDRNTISFANKGMRIDLGGIAKGYAVDQGIEILKACGIKHAIVSAGGDSRILGDKKGRAWMIGIQHPRQKGKLALTIPLSDSAISTSGDYERFFIVNNERIHHIIDPDTGKSANKSWSASVIGPEATATDALSTTVFILGTKKGLALINRLDDFDAIIIDASGTVHYSSGLMDPDNNQAGKNP